MKRINSFARGILPGSVMSETPWDHNESSFMEKNSETSQGCIHSVQFSQQTDSCLGAVQSTGKLEGLWP